MSDAATPAQNAPATTPAAPAGQDGGYAEAQLNETQHAALKEVANLRIEYGKAPSDKILEKMSALQKFALGGGEKPSDFLPSDPAPPDLSEHDSLAASFGDGLTRPMSVDELSQFKSAGTIKGLDPSVSGAVAALVQELAVPKVIANQILDRAVQHYGKDFDGPALPVADALRPLTPAEAQDYYETASRMMGGSAKFDSLVAEVRTMLAQQGILGKLDKSGFTKSSLMFDPRVLLALRLFASARA